MISCGPLLCINIKHATLVNNCYPIKESSSTPHSSELSYLTFYASSRPVKLLKVGAFLERKVINDIKKSRITNNKVTLHILKALIQSCHRDLNIFSKYIVRILNLLLNDTASDIELMDLSCEAFILFSAYDDGSTLNVDTEFTNDYTALITKWASLCGSSVLQMQYIGQRAVQAAVTSAAFHSFNYLKVQLNILFPPLIMTLANAKTPLDELETNHDNVDIRSSKTQDINEKAVEKLATHTISLLFNKITGASVRLSLSPLINYTDEKGNWWPPNLAVTIIKVILDALQPQYRYLLVSDLLFQLDSNENNEKKHAALIIILDNVLNANTPLVGISVLEVLNSLFTLLTSNNNDDITKSITHAIGGLGSQIYYDNQLNDITSYLVSKLRPNTSLNQVDNIEIHPYRLKVLDCLDAIVGRTNEANVIPLYAWTPALGLLLDENKLTRVAFCLTFSRFLKQTVTRVIVNPKEEFPAHTLIHYHDGVFVDRFMNTLYDWIQRPDLTKLDLQFFYTIVCTFQNKFGVDATISIFSLLFKIQNDNQQQQQKGKSIFAVQSVLFSILNNMGRFYYIPSLTTYIESLQELNQCEQDGFVDIKHSELLLSTESEPVGSSGNDQPKLIKKWVDKSEVVGLLSKDGHLRDENDVHSLDLESKLFAEWGSELLLKKNSKARIQITSDDIHQVKPELASPWVRSSNPQLTVALHGNKSDILVETLKGALSAQSTTTAGEEDSDSTQSTSLSSNSKPRMPADMSSLLNELNIPQIKYSTVSLVNPPYSS